MKPLIRVCIPVSADGYIADRDSSLAWKAAIDPDTLRCYSFEDGIGAVVMGRTAYGQSAAQSVWPHSAVPCYVLAHRDDVEAPPSGVHVWTDGVTSLAHHLKATITEGDIWVEGGSKVITSFLEEDLIDRFELRVVPVLLGGGIPLLSGINTPTWLALEGVEPLDDGVVAICYRRRAQA